jgi:hypothetical protein
VRDAEDTRDDRDEVAAFDVLVNPDLGEAVEQNDDGREQKQIGAVVASF